MTPKQIAERLTELTTALVEKTGEQPFVDPKLSVYDTGECVISLYRGYNDGAYDLGSVRAKSFKGALHKADQFVADLPSKDEAERRDFIKALGAVIDNGNDIGIDIEFMNPLTETMRTLSENIITDQRNKEDQQ